MALKINRLDKWYGGITNGDRDVNLGVALNIEELDIFSNPNFIQAETVLAAETSITSGSPRRIWGFTSDNLDNLYAISDDGGATPKADIWQLTTASVANPGNFTLWLDGGQNSRNTYASNLIWQGIGNPVTSARIYYVTGTNSLYYQGVSITNGAISGSETSVGTLSGLVAASKYIPMIRVDGELFIGHGQYVANVDVDGNFTSDAFTLPSDWQCISFAAISGDQLAILAKSNVTGSNECKIFFWDKTDTTSFDDVVTLPMGGPQAIINHNEILRIWCAKDSILRIYEIQGKIPIKTHEISCDTTLGDSNGDYTIYPQSIFTRNNIVYFGLARTTADNDSGLYALGKTQDDKPLALILSKRFSATNAQASKTHKPLAATAVGSNVYAAYIDTTSTTTWGVLRTEEGNSPTRSSNGIYESILIDGGAPEYNKSWRGFILTAKSMPASCSIAVDARVDNASSYDSNATQTLSASNDQVGSGETADTFWYRQFTSVIGRQIQIKLTFTSSGTTTAKLYSLSLISEANKLF